MNSIIRRILEETGSTNVKDIVYDEDKKEWVVSYQNGLAADTFPFFESVMEWLATEDVPRDSTPYKEGDNKIVDEWLRDIVNGL